MLAERVADVAAESSTMADEKFDERKRCLSSLVARETPVSDVEREASA